MSKVWLEKDGWVEVKDPYKLVNHMGVMPKDVDVNDMIEWKTEMSGAIVRAGNLNWHGVLFYRRYALQPVPMPLLEDITPGVYRLTGNFEGVYMIGRDRSPGSKTWIIHSCWDMAQPLYQVDVNQIKTMVRLD